MFGVLTEAAMRVNPDIIHTNSSLLPIGAYLAEALNLPHVWHIRELGRLHFNFRFFPGLTEFYLWLAKAHRVIVISKAVQEVSYRRAGYYN